MKHLLTCTFLLLFTLLTQAQNPAELDKSPLDVSYWPANYPILKMNGKAAEQPVARIIYSRPQKGDRTIFGGIVKYGDVWRLGANEATELECFRNIKVNGKSLPKGRYTMYAICTDSLWTIIFNNEKDVWGLLYNAEKDVLRVQVPVKISSDPVDAFTIFFDTKEATMLTFMWDKTSVQLPVSY